MTRGDGREAFRRGRADGQADGAQIEAVLTLQPLLAGGADGVGERCARPQRHVLLDARPAAAGAAGGTGRASRLRPSSKKMPEPSCKPGSPVDDDVRPRPVVRSSHSGHLAAGRGHPWDAPVGGSGQPLGSVWAVRRSSPAPPSLAGYGNGTCSGSAEGSVVPFPSWPEELSPQTQNEPSAFCATACA